MCQVGMSKCTNGTELGELQRRARELAKERREQPGTAHLLAALAETEGPAAGLFRDRRVGPADLLGSVALSPDQHEGALPLALSAARQVAERLRSPVAHSLHLVIALLSDRRNGAYQALVHCGIDVSRLRLAAMNLGLSHSERQPAMRSAAGRSRTTERSATRGRLGHRGKAQLVSLHELRARRRASPPATVVETAPTKKEKPTSCDPERYRLPEKQYPMLTQLGRNLTLAAACGELDTVVRRDTEVEQVLDIVAKRFANNACIVGEPGVGKTHVAYAVAARSATQQGSGSADEFILVEVNTGTLLAGTAHRGGLSARIQALVKELDAGPQRVVLFFDEIHQLFSGDGGEELASEFKSAVSRGGFQCIGATSSAEYCRHIEGDAALHRRFSVVRVEEPSREDAFLMLGSLVQRFRQHHGVELGEEATALSVAWSIQYLPGRALPDKAVSVADLAAARARRRGQSIVSVEQVAEVVSEASGVPIERLLQSDSQRLLDLEQELSKRVVGHQRCLASIARSIRRNAAGLGASRPVGAFLLLGPTGVGKTETAKALAQALYSSHQAMTRIDLSEYSEPHSVARLLGAPPGYVGHEAGGVLTEAVRRRPYQVVLLDEFEKAHEEVMHCFLPLLDEGRLTDGRGRTVDFTNTVILLTSNLGVRELSSRRSVGFGHADHDAPLRVEQLERAAREKLSPELFNRLDEVLVFEALSQEQVQQVAQMLLAALSNRVAESKGIRLKFADSVIELLCEQGGVDVSLGARPMRRAIARLVEAPLSELILQEAVGSGDELRVFAGVEGLQFEIASSDASAAE